MERTTPAEALRRSQLKARLTQHAGSSLGGERELLSACLDAMTTEQLQQQAEGLETIATIRGALAGAIRKTITAAAADAQPEPSAPPAPKTANNNTTLLVRGGNVAGYGIGYVPAGKSGRKEYGGPLVDGPWAYAYALAAVIDNKGGTGAILEQFEKAGQLIRAEYGETILVDGHPYKIEPDNNKQIKLTPST